MISSAQTSRRTDHPVCAASPLAVGAATPPLRGGEYLETMIELDDALNELVIANRILASENVVDAYGHVSVRNPRKPERFFMAHMLATPEIVERSDIVEFGSDRSEERRVGKEC